MLDIADASVLDECLRRERPARVVHLAAQAGVRHSLENPMAYVSSNLVGFGSILEACRRAQVGHLVFASSSSVYGNNARLPFSEHDPADHPLSLYAATKRSNELMAHAYAHLYGLPSTGLRFFTVYGPWGRPDMAPILFAHAIAKGTPIQVFNRGNHRRDFTYVDDVVAGVVAVALGKPVAGQAQAVRPDDPATGSAPFRLYNIGNGNPVRLMDFLSLLETSLGKKALLEMVDAQPGDVLETWSDCSDLQQDFGYHAHVSMEEGMARFAAWFRDYYSV
jgi:UDP-glucuronate 4-epimerase